MPRSRSAGINCLRSCAVHGCWCHPRGHITKPRTAIIDSGGTRTYSKTVSNRSRRTLLSKYGWADITYLPTPNKYVHLSLVTDAYSRKIVGYHVHDSLQTEQVSQAFQMALKGRKTSHPLVHHSDRGIQYCSAYYQEIHRRYDITCSMTDGYDCYQNALAERVNGILKMEFLLHRPANLAQAKKMVKESVQIYNHKRPHTSLKYKTPDEVHRASLEEIKSQFINPQTVNL